MEKQFVAIEPNTWKPANDGDLIEGVYIRTEDSVGINKSKLHHFEVQAKPLSVWGTTVLDDRMAYVKPGELVSITYKGTAKNKRGQDTKIFKVEISKEVA